MNIELLYSAVELVRASGYRGNPREAAFMRAYPILVSTARSTAPSRVDGFLRVASLAYAWMPQTMRLDMGVLDAAAEAWTSAIQEVAVVSQETIEPIAHCLGSVVGAAKALHLSNPAVFPMWDQRVERFRLQAMPSSYHMGQTRNYLSFIEDVGEIAAHPLFLTFHNEYCTAYQARLQRLKIPAYPLTEPRVIESAASELASQ